MAPTTYSLRDLGVSPGQSKQEALELQLEPYRQAGVDYAPRGGVVAAVLDVTAMTEGNSFRLRFSADFDGPCARCLEPATLHVDIDGHEVHDETAPEDDEDLRSHHVDEKALLLDVTSWGQEAVGLQFPPRVLCRPDCRGLCGECGANLNDEPEHGHERPTDSRWDALKDLKLEGE